MLILALPFLAACGLAPSLTPYRMEIQQGNYITQEMVAQLKPGLTRDQVRFVLGTPLVSDIFHEERWDYVFVRQRANSRDSNRSDAASRLAAVFADVFQVPEDGIVPNHDGVLKTAAFDQTVFDQELDLFEKTKGARV